MGRRQQPGWCEEWRFYYSITENLIFHQQSGIKTDTANNWDYVWALALCRRGSFGVTKPSVFTWGDWASVWWLGTEGIGVFAGICAGSWAPAWRLTAGWELPLVCSVPVLQALPRAESSEPGALWGQFPLDWRWHRRWHKPWHRQLLSLTCCSPQDRWRLCLVPQLEAQGLSPGLPQQPTDTAQPARALNPKTRQKINSFGSCGFQRNWGEGGGRQRNRKIQSSLVHSVCLLHLRL